MKKTITISTSIEKEQLKEMKKEDIGVAWLLRWAWKQYKKAKGYLP